VTLSSRQRIAAAAVLILLLLFLVRPGVSRLKTRITASISRAIDRPVEIGAVHLRFLPRPGFDLENLVIYEDPAFGAEPMLRASEVTAIVRLTSLFRGRLDISRLELTEPSLNLVRRKEDGRWNLATLLERTRRTPLAPTAKSKSEPRPGFPYIEASSGRINFKSGAEKKPYALLDADFALWQESENSWGVRLKAQPLRTDMSLTDTGLLRVSGTWQRAPSLLETPLQFTAEWNKSQLGQLTKLVSGADKGWRGDSRLEVSLTGTPSALQVSADASIQGFHRYDIVTSDSLSMAAHCDGQYNAAVGALREIFCTGPVSGGLVTLKGDAGPPNSHLLNLTLDLEGVPANSVVQLIRRAKKDLPSDLLAQGTVRGNFSVREDGPSSAEFQGAGELLEFHLRSASNKVEFAPGKVPFVLSSQTLDRSVRKSTHNSNLEPPPPTGEVRIDYGPFPVALGRPASAQAHGWLSRSGYGLSLRGEGEISQTLRAASLFGLPALKANATGIAQLDLEGAGSWSASQSTPASGFSAPAVIGTVQLHNIRATAHGLHGPIEISSAELKLSPTEARIEKLNAQAADAHWTGSITLPRGCGTPDACAIQFNLNSDDVVLSALFGWLGSHPMERRWYQVLAPSDPQSPSILRNLRAAGTVNISQLLVHHVPMNRVSAALDLNRGKLNISDLRFDVLGGKHRGNWQADFTGTTPLYKGSGTFTNIALQQAANSMHNASISEQPISEKMASGRATATYQLAADGKNSAAFWRAAEGEVHFNLEDAVFPRISLTNDASPLQISHWQGAASLHDGKIEIQNSEIVSPSNLYEVIGSATLSQAIDLKLTDASKVTPAHPITYRITGTLTEPLVTQTPPLETQARLKR
jgi:hypothetical protein